MVYVLSKDGQPLMPTKRHGKVKHLLKQGKAKVIRRCPFTIQLLYDTVTYVQDVTLGVDAGSKHVGLSAVTENKVLYEADITLRTDITELLSIRREQRRTRRNRLRYRKPRFLNRVHSKNKGWLAPSVEHKIQTHITSIANVCKILPVTKIVVETAAFDTQMLKAMENDGQLPQGADYQQGEQLGFWNVREYVLFRDNHVCQCCKGKSMDKILNVHHIESRKTGGNSPGNLITLCETCHKKYHQGLLRDFRPKRQTPYRDAAFMGIMRWTLYKHLKELYPDVSMTYGYITKNTRITNGLPKGHHIDARCIGGSPLAKSDGTVYYQKKVRCHNRQIYKVNLLKGGIKKPNQAPYEVKGYRLFDRVSVKGREYYIHGRRLKGAFLLKTLDGNVLEIAPSKIRFLAHQKSFITERRLVG